MPERVYRRLNISDLPMVLQMNRDFQDGYNCREENARLFLSQPHNWLFACIEDGRILGYVYGFEINRLDDAGNMLYIHALGVLPEYHRQGIGRQMLTSIKALCKLSGICRFFLTAFRSNEAACGLYNAMGGETDDEEIVRYFFNQLD